jgi:hypothetical protein
MCFARKPFRTICYNEMSENTEAHMALSIQASIFSEMAEFISSEPSIEAVAAYQIPSNVQERVDFLLEKNSDGSISAEEKQELEKILVIGDLMNLAKAKAKLKLAGKA